MTTDTHAIVFDFGGVLLEWNPHKLYDRFFPGQTEAIQAFMSEVRFSEWNTLQDQGRPFAQGVRELSSQFPQHAHLIQAFHEHWSHSVVGPIEGTVSILKQLKQKRRSIFGLSNWSAETFPIARRRYDFFDLFDDILISGEVGLVKPDPAIFNLLLERIGRKAEECIFIDDSPPNIQAAGRLGFNAIHYHSPDQLERELEKLGAL
jgi:2-haloacid dehalogenase